MKKVIFIVFDGLGDEEIPELKGKTPLDYAQTPNFDRMARNGLLGLLEPTFYGQFPTSEEGHFSLFGYDPQKYGLKRGVVTAKSVGIFLEKGDVALRGNFATLFQGRLIDRRAGRIENTEELVKLLNEVEVDGVRFVVRGAGGHRLAVVMKGGRVSADITSNDPAYNKEGVLKEIKAAKETEEAKFTAKVLNKFLQKAQLLLEKSTVNKKRKFPANYIILRGASEKTEKLPSFFEKYNVKATCIAGKKLYRDIGEMIGMDPIVVQGATGNEKTNIKGKLEAALTASSDFVFVHFKATDTLAEDGKYKEKVSFLERADKEMAVLSEFQGKIVLTADHSTCSLLKRHCKKKIPFLFYGKGKDDRERFTENECAKGSLGVVEQVKMMEKVDLFS